MLGCGSGHRPEMTLKPDSRSTSSFNFAETVVICDHQDWQWTFLHAFLKHCKYEHVRVQSDFDIKSCWERFAEAPFFIICWENQKRPAASIIREMKILSPDLDYEKVIIITTHPTHEDVVYFSELGLDKIVSLQQNKRGIKIAGQNFTNILRPHKARRQVTHDWKILHKHLDQMLESSTDDNLLMCEAMIDRIKLLHKEEVDTASWWDALACIEAAKSNDKVAIEYWHTSLEKNPNFFRVYHNLIQFYTRRRNHEKALGLLEKMHVINRNNIDRLVCIANTYTAMQDHRKAEHYFEWALSKDPYNNDALNALAGMHFKVGDLRKTKTLLKDCHDSGAFASSLNQEGIRLVNEHSYEKALELYLNALHVLPSQEKSPLVFFNIGLCYSRWGKYAEAREYVSLSLAKDPRYRKARKLLRWLNHECPEETIIESR